MVRQTHYEASVIATTLLMVGGHGEPVLEMNPTAYDALIGDRELVIVLV
ncbi:MAG: hypothetical protein IPM58_08465 [Nitrospira sp.]|nr:hypothetical protein [Nitrospira sp.]